MLNDFYVQIDKNGNMIGHPYSGENLRHALNINPDIDSNYEPFQRISLEQSNVVPNLLQKVIHSYQKNNNIWQDVWTIVDLTGDELNIKEQEIRDDVGNFVKIRIGWANDIISQTTSEDDKKQCQDHINAIQSFTVTNFNVIGINLPKLPYKDKDNIWHYIQLNQF
jgi:hypothetical protein